MDFVVADVRDHVLTLRLNRIEKRNALTGGMYTALADVLADVNSAPNIKTVILRGSESCFCSGNDLDDFLRAPPMDLGASVFRFMNSIVELNKPLIAAVCGPAIGIGATILPHCDLVYVTHESQISFPFVKLGLCQEFGASLTLPLVVGALRARHLLLTGEIFSGREALEWGLASHGFDTPSECLSAAEEQARMIALLPEKSVRLSKQLMRSVTLEDLKTVIKAEGEAFLQCVLDQEAREIFLRKLIRG